MLQYSQCLEWKLYFATDYIFIQNDTLLYLPHNISYPNGEYRLISNDTAFVCIPEDVRPPFYHVDILYIVSWIFSIAALSLALSFHWIVPSASTIYDSRPLLWHMISLLLFYILELLYQTGPHFSTTVCYILAIWGQYTLRAAFCWLNVVTFDMWRRFHPQRIITVSLRASCVKYSCQSLYAWGVPALILVISNLLIFVKVPFLPGYKVRCLVSMYENSAQVIFFYASTSVTLLVNIVFFVLTCLNLRTLSMDVALANNKIYSQMLRMYIKLLVVTGTCWILEVLEWALIPLKVKPIYWIAPDVLNALQGLFLFLIYNCNVNMKTQLSYHLSRKITRLKTSSSMQSHISSISI